MTNSNNPELGGLISPDSIKSTPEETNVPEVDEAAIESTDAKAPSTISQIQEQLEPVKKTEIVKEPTVRPNQNVSTEYNINMPEKLTGEDTIELPSNYLKETNKILDQLPNVQLLDTTEAKRWAHVLSEGIDYATYSEAFVPSLEDPESQWTNKPEVNGVNFGSSEPKFKAIENQKLTGERAVLRVVNHMGIGTVFQTALYHSGFWVSFKPPVETEIVELNRQLIADKIEYGRATYGMAFSNATSYTVSRLMEFALAHVYEITVKPEDMKIEDILKHMSCQDIPSFLWGFICTMYPRGFNYRRACEADPENCKHIIEETINVMKLQYTNMKGLNDWQKSFMSGRQPKSKELSAVSRYKDELSKLQKKRIVINKDTDREIAFVLKTPSVLEYIEAGHRWIGNTQDIVQRALQVDANDNERNALIIRHSQATAMRQYGHWVESIEYGTNTIEDFETIEQTLNVLSADDAVRVEFTKGVVNYINNSMISVIGIPVFDCPACNKTQPSQFKLPNHSNIIPLDVMQVFFGLHTQQIIKLTER